MIRHIGNDSESWKNLPWKKFRKDLFRLQKRVFKAVQAGNKRKARSLQRLILKSKAARFLAIRQVTQLNTGKKTAGIDGVKSLDFTGRFDLETILKESVGNWHHQGLREIPIPKKDGTTRMLKIPTPISRNFDFLGWHFKVLSDGRFKSYPSVDNFKKFRLKVKNIVNCSNYGSQVKAEKLAPIVRGWRNYHRFCDMSGARFSLWFLSHRTYTVFNQETKNTRESSVKLVKKAFPTVPYSENKHINVKGDKSPYDGDLTYWSERNSKLYDDLTSKALKKQSHSCGHCGMKFMSDERVNLHHIDENHDNWKPKNLLATHESCHDYLHMSKRVNP